MRHIAASFALGLLCGATALAQNAEGTPLTNEEALAFIKGKSLTAIRTAGGTPSIQFRDNGLMYGSNQGSSDSGRWRIEEGKLCMTWNRWEYEGCGKLVRVGTDVQHLYPDGTTVHLIFKSS